MSDSNKRSVPETEQVDVGATPTLPDTSPPSALATPAPPGPDTELTLSLVDVGQAPIDATRPPERYGDGERLGAGGMGEVRLVEDRRLGRRVARKVMHLALESETARERFLREVRVQGQLEHPSIVPVYDLDQDADGTIWFTMKRIRGLTLEQILVRLQKGDEPTKQRFTRARLLAVFAQVCHALHYAHARGVVHRDLKPSNVMVGDFGEVYVLDWGLALVLGEAATIPRSLPPPSGVDRLTGRDAVVGTLAYMAPEQVTRRNEGIDGRVDIFALGVMLFEILVGRPMRPKATLGDVLRGAREVTRPADHASDVPPELDAAAARAMAPDPKDRHPSAGALAESVERFLDGDRDLALRRELAARHVERAEETLRRRDTAAGREARAELRLSAMREVTKALALDAENKDAQKTFVGTLTEEAADLPNEAALALQRDTDRKRAAGAKLGMMGFLAWLCTAPLAYAAGVRDWTMFWVTAISTASCAALAAYMWRRGTFGLGYGATLATLTAIVVAATSCYMGPFALVPTCAATSSLLFAMHATRVERIVSTTLLSLGAAAPFAWEWLGFGHAYDFRPDSILVHAQAIALPRGWTMIGMLYVSLSFVIFAAWLVGQMRDSLMAAERHQFLQSWTLRQLFPAR